MSWSCINQKKTRSEVDKQPELGPAILYKEWFFTDFNILTYVMLPPN